MAAALFRRGTGLCCIQRELCRLVWRPQTAQFSSKPPDGKPPRRTHIKKAKPQPAVDIAKLLEQLFHQRGPGTAPPVARPTKPPVASSMNVSASNVPPLSKTNPAASVSPAASSFKQVDACGLSSVTVPKTSGSTAASLASEAAAVECQTSMETIETATETVELETARRPLSDHEASSFPSASIEIPMESPVEHILSHPVEPSVEALAEEVQTKSTDVSYSAKIEPLIETTIEPPVEASHSTMGTLETRSAVVEGPVEPPIDLAAEKVETKNTDSGPVHLLHAAEEEPLIETTMEPAVEASPVSEGTIEPAIETESGDNLSHAALIQNAEASAPLPLKNEPTIESVNAAEEGGNRSEEMTLESVTLHVDQVLVESFKINELLQTISVLDEKAEKQVRGLLVQTEIGAESSSDDEPEILTEVLSKWDSLSEDLREFEGESGTLVEELLCHARPKTPRSVSPAADPPVGERMEDTVGGAEAVMLESKTLAEGELEVGGLEAEDLRETRNEEESDVPAKEETVEVATAIDVEKVFEETAEAEILTLDSISEAAEEAQAVEAVLGSEQGPRPPQEAERESGDWPGGVSEAMSLESVTLAEVEASLGTLEKESLSETTNLLENAAEIVAGEQKMEVEDVVPPEETPGALSLAEDLQMEALMEELLFSVPAPVSGVTGDQVGRETGTADTSDAAVAAGSVDVDAAPEVKDDLKEVMEGDGQETLTDLDPVQRLFLEKIKEYNNMSRLNGELLEAEPDYEKYISEETAKLRRLYGGGDLTSFPQFTFTEPQLDQDSK